MTDMETSLIRDDPFYKAIQAMSDEEYITWIVIVSEKLSKEEKAKNEKT
jgi:hypothetical protein